MGKSQVDVALGGPTFGRRGKGQDFPISSLNTCLFPPPPHYSPNLGVRVGIREFIAAIRSIEAHMPCFTATQLHILTIVLLFFCFCTPIAQSVPDNSGSIRLPSEGFTSTDENGGVCARFMKPASCPVNCFRTEPVCGVDGVTYWCGCADALCAGTHVAKAGFCEVGNGGSASFPGQALLLVHIVWLILLGFSLLCGLF